MADIDDLDIESVWLPPEVDGLLKERGSIEPEMYFLEYNQEICNETNLQKLEDFKAYKDNQTVKWLNMKVTNDVNFFKRLAVLFEINPLTIEDIVNLNHFTKIEEFDDYLFIVLKIFKFENAKSRIKSDQISLILKQDLVITFIEKDVYCFDKIKEKIRSSKIAFRKYGSDFLAYSIIDMVVDDYFDFFKEITNQLEDLEARILKDPSRHNFKLLHDFKKRVSFLRQGIWPIREMVSLLEKVGEPLIYDYMNSYLRDLYDHSYQLIETLEITRENISNMFDIFLSISSNKMNEIMKVLTIIATIFIPLTFIAGVYGMNFKYMPELEWKYGYYLIWAIMISLAAGMLFYFKKQKWF